MYQWWGPNIAHTADAEVRNPLRVGAVDERIAVLAAVAVNARHIVHFDRGREEEQAGESVDDGQVIVSLSRGTSLKYLFASAGHGNGHVQR